MSDLQDKIAIVTGANSGMGMATVKALSDKGATVIMLCRSEEQLCPQCEGEVSPHRYSCQ